MLAENILTDNDKSFRETFSQVADDVCHAFEYIPVSSLDIDKTLISQSSELPLKIKKFLRTWLKKNKGNQEKLNQFYQYFTGATNSNVKIKIRQRPSPVCHACFQMMDIPKKPNKISKDLMTAGGLSHSKSQSKWTETNFGHFIDGWIKEGLEMGIA